MGYMVNCPECGGRWHINSSWVIMPDETGRFCKNLPPRTYEKDGKFYRICYECRNKTDEQASVLPAVPDEKGS